jgi:diadenosine tetraphosphate (Ap4A) HIT family hydrolase
MFNPDCVACGLSDGRLDLPGGLIHGTSLWRVEHCIGPLGVGTLIVKPIRHVEHLGDLSGAEARQLGPLLRRIAQVVAELCAPRQVYVCLWSHGPLPIHFVVQPETDELLAEFSAHGPKLQVGMFDRGTAPDSTAVAAFARAARNAFENDVHGNECRSAPLR